MCIRTLALVLIMVVVCRSTLIRADPGIQEPSEHKSAAVSNHAREPATWQTVPLVSLSVEEIRHATPPLGGFRQTLTEYGYEVSFPPYPVETILRVVSGSSPGRTVVGSKLPTARYKASVTLHAAESRLDRCRRCAAELIAAECGVRYEIKKEQRDVWVASGGKDDLPRAKGNFSCALHGVTNRWIGKAATLTDLCKELERGLGVVVLNEASLRGRYDFELPFESIETVAAALEQNYGIRLSQAKREVEVLHLSRVDRTSAQGR